MKKFCELLKQVTRWGSNVAVILPAKLVKALGLKVGDELEFKKTVIRKGHVTEMYVGEELSKMEILADVRNLRSEITHNFTFDRDEANSR